ncbi:MurR/RpiR family transcriptional regulator [Phytohabitans sp. ZYX-F-186]|uniref:MurR/RpiR family transcriptional regulator n=1 Tax=Phytohabitans maris TaxID=3071409 RepID=A0ABU0ZNZ9_9ACTN|nr:MurR/RpiR family transcriptional regulator [Phytohabitans sp. ZYX-F-186]MDQ7908758.1 MurR/RpiR family transcriptional regulator [Phytohabitans sp. ZYX-F-186]
MSQPQTDVPVAGRVVSAIIVAMPTLVPSDARVAQAILDNPERVLSCSASELAEIARTAPSTVVHASKALGFQGFQDLKLTLAKDLGGAQGVHHGALSESPNDEEILTKILSTSAQTIMASLQTIDRTAFSAAVRALRQAKRILVLGSGTSRAPADDISYRLTMLGLDAIAPADGMAQHNAARRLGPADAVLAVSQTGSSRGTIEGVRLARMGGAAVVALTSHLRSALTERADVTLVAGAPEAGFRLEAATSRLAHLALADALYVALAYANPKLASETLDRAAEVTVLHSI